MFMLWWMRVGSFNLNKTLGAYCLIAASGLIEVWRVVEETDRTFRGIFI